MIVGFKGDSNKLKDLYKELGLKEVKPTSFEELEKALSENDGATVISNYNDIMVFENPTADLVEKRNKVLKVVSKMKNNVYLSLLKNDPSLDKLKMDVAICTKVNTNDIKLIEEIFSFCNTDLPYSGKLGDNQYAVRMHDELRAEAKSLDELKKILK